MLAVALLAIAGWQMYTGRRAKTSDAPSKTLPPTAAAPRAVTALGRLKPQGGIVRVAGPSYFSVVLSRLLVEEGDSVGANQVIAVLDTNTALQATVTQLEAELANAEFQWRKVERLFDQKIVSEWDRDEQKTKVDVARAALAKARADLEQSVVRSPISGRVLKVHCRSGEKVGPDGIIELGRTDRMYAVAEVYETDLPRVRTGQRARISSPALVAPLEGTVERVGREIGKQDVLATDPAARTDARVAEVEIRLDDSRAVAGLTHLQVEVVFDPSP